MLKRGDNKAYKYLYDNYYTPLCKLSYYILRDRAMAENTVSDVIVNIWESRERLSLQPPLRNYLMASVRNKSLNYLALKRHQCELTFSSIESSGILLQNIIPDSQQPLGTLLSKEFETKIAGTIDRLPPVCKKVFVMSRFREMTYDDISKELGISTNTVKYHIKNALAVLKKELEIFLSFFIAFILPS